MNPSDELYKRLDKYLDTLEKATEQGVDFALNQAPIVVQEFVMYQRVVSTFYLLTVLALIFYGLWMLGRPEDKFGKMWKNLDDHPFPARVAGFICTLIGIGILSVSNVFPHVVKAWLAPRYLILEEIGKWL